MHSSRTTCTTCTRVPWTSGAVSPAVTLPTGGLPPSRCCTCASHVRQAQSLLQGVSHARGVHGSELECDLLLPLGKSERGQVLDKNRARCSQQQDLSQPPGGRTAAIHMLRAACSACCCSLHHHVHLLQPSTHQHGVVRWHSMQADEPAPGAPVGARRHVHDEHDASETPAAHAWPPRPNMLAGLAPGPKPQAAQRTARFEIKGNGVTSCYMCGGRDHNFETCPEFQTLSSKDQVSLLHFSGRLRTLCGAAGPADRALAGCGAAGADRARGCPLHT